MSEAPAVSYNTVGVGGTTVSGPQPQIPFPGAHADNKHDSQGLELAEHVRRRSGPILPGNVNRLGVNPIKIRILRCDYASGKNYKYYRGSLSSFFVGIQE